MSLLTNTLAEYMRQNRGLPRCAVVAPHMLIDIKMQLDHSTLFDYGLTQFSFIPMVQYSGNKMFMFGEVEMAKDFMVKFSNLIDQGYDPDHIAELCYNYNQDDVILLDRPMGDHFCKSASF